MPECTDLQAHAVAVALCEVLASYVGALAYAQAVLAHVDCKGTLLVAAFARELAKSRQEMSEDLPECHKMTYSRPRDMRALENRDLNPEQDGTSPPRPGFITLQFFWAFDRVVKCGPFTGKRARWQGSAKLRQVFFEAFKVLAKQDTDPGPEDRPEKLATLLNSTGEAPPTPHELAVGLRAAVEAYYKSWDWEPPVWDVPADGQAAEEEEEGAAGAAVAAMAAPPPAAADGIPQLPQAAADEGADQGRSSSSSHERRGPVADPAADAVRLPGQAPPAEGAAAGAATAATGGSVAAPRTGGAAAAGRQRNKKQQQQQQQQQQQGPGQRQVPLQLQQVPALAGMALNHDHLHYSTAAGQLQAGALDPVQVPLQLSASQQADLFARDRSSAAAGVTAANLAALAAAGGRDAGAPGGMLDAAAAGGGPGCELGSMQLLGQEDSSGRAVLIIALQQQQLAHVVAEAAGSGVSPGSATSTPSSSSRRQARAAAAAPMLLQQQMAPGVAGSALSPVPEQGPGRTASGTGSLQAAPHACPSAAPDGVGRRGAGGTAQGFARYDIAIDSVRGLEHLLGLPEKDLQPQGADLGRQQHLRSLLAGLPPDGGDPEAASRQPISILNHNNSLSRKGGVGVSHSTAAAAGAAATKPGLGYGPTGGEVHSALPQPPGFERTSPQAATAPDLPGFCSRSSNKRKGSGPAALPPKAPPPAPAQGMATRSGRRRVELGSSNASSSSSSKSGPTEAGSGSAAAGAQGQTPLGGQEGLTAAGRGGGGRAGAGAATSRGTRAKSVAAAAAAAAAGPFDALDHLLPGMRRLDPARGEPVGPGDLQQLQQDQLHKDDSDPSTTPSEPQEPGSGQQGQVTHPTASRQGPSSGQAPMASHLQQLVGQGSSRELCNGGTGPRALGRLLSGVQGTASISHGQLPDLDASAAAAAAAAAGDGAGDALAAMMAAVAKNREQLSRRGFGRGMQPAGATLATAAAGGGESSGASTALHGLPPRRRQGAEGTKLLEAWGGDASLNNLGSAAARALQHQRLQPLGDPSEQEGLSDLPRSQLRASAAGAANAGWLLGAGQRDTAGTLARGDVELPPTSSARLGRPAAGKLLSAAGRRAAEAAADGQGAGGRLARSSSHSSTTQHGLPPLQGAMAANMPGQALQRTAAAGGGVIDATGAVARPTAAAGAAAAAVGALGDPLLGAPAEHGLVGDQAAQPGLAGAGGAAAADLSSNGLLDSLLTRAREAGIPQELLLRALATKGLECVTQELLAASASALLAGTSAAAALGGASGTAAWLGTMPMAAAAGAGPAAAVADATTGGLPANSRPPDPTARGQSGASLYAPPVLLASGGGGAAAAAAAGMEGLLGAAPGESIQQLGFGLCVT